MHSARSASAVACGMPAMTRAAILAGLRPVSGLKPRCEIERPCRQAPADGPGDRPGQVSRVRPQSRQDGLGGLERRGPKPWPVRHARTSPRPRADGESAMIELALAFAALAAVTGALAAAHGG